MNSNDFTAIIEAQIERSSSVLVSKNKEYASETDRLSNFKTAAALQGITPSQALAGMMAKHTQSVYSMIMSGEAYTTEMWNEKITDHINYLLLLRAVVEEEHNNSDEPWQAMTHTLTEMLRTDSSVISIPEDQRISIEAEKIPSDLLEAHEYELPIPSRETGEAIIARMVELLENYGLVTVADLHDLNNQTTQFKDTKWGWKSMSTTRVMRDDQGYRLLLPKPEAV